MVDGMSNFDFAETYFYRMIKIITHGSTLQWDVTQGSKIKVSG